MSDMQRQLEFQLRPGPSVRVGAPCDGAALDERFRLFHDENPQVYRKLRDLALQMRRRGVTRYGIAGLFEVLRYESALETGGDEFKLNNNWRAFYARLLADNEPELREFFELRTQRWLTNEVGS